MNRSRNPGERSPTETEAVAPESPPAEPARRTRARRTTTRAADAPVAEQIEAPTIDTVAAVEPVLAEVTAPDADAAPRTRTRGTRGGRGRRRPGDAAPTAGDEAVAAAPSSEAPITEPEPDVPSVAEDLGELADAQPQTGPDGVRPRTRRGSRGRGGSRPEGETARPGVDVGRAKGIAGPTVESERNGPTQRERPYYDRPPRPDRNDRERPRPATIQPPRRNGGPSPAGGSIEQLIARQNVLFEDFAQTQTQAIRDIQRTVTNINRSSGGGGGHMMAMPKVGVFVDVPNLIYTSEQMGVRIHFGRLLDVLTDGRQLVRATAYAPITDDPQTRFEAQRFVAPVVNQGYKIVSKPWKRFADGSMKANFDIELAVDILTMSDRLDVVVLLSGDGDFRRVCELVESKGVRVEVVAFAQSTSIELRSVADLYTDLNTILNQVSM